MSTVNAMEMNTSMLLGTFAVTSETTVADLKAMMLGREGQGNEDMLSIYFGGRKLSDGDRVLSVAGNGGTVVVRFGPASSEGGRRRRNTRRRKNMRRH